MTWVRIDDQFADHPKIVGLSAPAFRLHVTAICYAARQETDGFIPRHSAFVKAAQRYAVELVSAKLWDDAEGGFQIHDYLEYNPSAQSLRDRRTADSARKTNGIQRGANRPVPTRPLPIPKTAAEAAVASAGAAADQEGEEGVRRCVVAYDGLMGALATTPPLLREITDWLETSPQGYDGPTLFEEACHEAALNNGKSLKYVLKILERWKREGKEDRRQKPTQGGGAAPEMQVILGGVAVKTFEQELADQRRAKNGA